MGALSQKPRVLCFGRDLQLLSTRLLVLTRSYDAVEVSSVEQLEDLPAEPPFELVLFCHSLSPKECCAAAEIVQRRWPATKILALTTAGSEAPYEAADAVVVSIQGPAVLLKAIDQLIHRLPLPSASHPNRAI